jgi:hypothetical protein
MKRISRVCRGLQLPLGVKFDTLKRELLILMSHETLQYCRGYIAGLKRGHLITKTQMKALLASIALETERLEAAERRKHAR